AGEVPTKDEWNLRLLILADAHLPIGAVDAGRHHIDHHLARRGDRVRPIAVFQDIGAAILLNENRLHRVASAIRDGRRSATPGGWQNDSHRLYLSARSGLGEVDRRAEIEA